MILHKFNRLKLLAYIQIPNNNSCFTKKIGKICKKGLHSQNWLGIIENINSNSARLSDKEFENCPIKNAGVV